MVIHKIITHVLDRNMDKPLLNDFEGRVSAEIDKFIQGTIKKISKDPLLRKAKFNDYDNNLIRECCENIIHNEKSFIENSKEIASYLFDVMQITTEIDSCDLVICLYTVKDDKRVAIVKFDYKQMYSHDINYEDDKFNIQIMQTETTISSSSKPTKAALVGVSGKNDEYDLFVVDKEAEKDSRRTKFISEFLNIDRVECDKFKTERFIYLINLFIDRYFGTEIDKAEYIRSAIIFKLFNKEQMHLIEIDNELLDSKDAREDFKSFCDKNDIEDFYIDKKTVKRLMSKRKFKTDTGINLSASIDAMYKENKVNITKNKSGTYDITLKNVGMLF